MGRGERLVPRCRASEEAVPSAQRCPFAVSATDQLSRAPKELPTPEPSACAPFRPTARSCLPCRARLHALVGTSSPQASMDRCRSFDPGWQHAVRRTTNCSLSRLPGGSDPCPGSDDWQPACSAGCEPVEIGVLTLHVMSPRPACACPRDTTSPSSLALRSQRAIPDSRAPCIDMSFGRSPTVAGERPSDGRHCCPCLAARTQLPTRVHEHAVLARPSSPRLFASPRRATCRTSTSAVERLREHTHGGPKPRFVTASRASAVASTGRDSEEPRASTNGWAVNRSGASALASRARFRQPTSWRPLAPSWD